MVGLRTVYAWEIRKLLRQKRTYIGVALAIGFPALFVIALSLQTGEPDDIAFGRYVRESGLAIPPVMLIFGSIWLFPLITSLVAGDIVAAEDHNGTLKTILTRSVGRGRVFTAKVLAALTYALFALFLMGIVALIGGVLMSGFHPLTTLSGTTVSSKKALLLLVVCFGIYFLPLIAVASIALLLSTLTHNSAGSVVGALAISILLQLVAILPGLESLQPYLLPNQFNAWQGLLRTPADWAPVIRAAWVCALYAAPCLAWAAWSFSRRDVTGG
ncbi:MAG: ABC transporter permease [Solirubrobacteraceae bacterium]|nr:ABC transporter permease [Patulibacter sp.]